MTPDVVGEFRFFPDGYRDCCRNRRQVWVGDLALDDLVQDDREGARRGVWAADNRPGQTIHPHEISTRIQDDSRVHTRVASQPTRIPNGK